jgi:heme/copper-type cytochrome/quinol oxidase subunit 2
MKYRLLLFLVAAGLALTVTACQPTAGGTQNFTLIMGEGQVIGEVDGEEVLTGEYHRWEPNVLVVHKGDNVALTVMNPRKNIHSFFLPGYNLDTGPLEGRTGEATLEFTADKAGVFQWICNIPNDLETGECDEDHETMVGYLIVLEN